MNIVKTTLITEAVFSDDGSKRYSLRKVWDKSKLSLAVVMLCPSTAAEIVIDTSTQLVLNNAFELGYGAVTIINLFATLNDFGLKLAESEDEQNIKAIVEAAAKASTIVYAPGVGKAKNKAFQHRQKQVLMALRQYEEKLKCICDENGESRLQHPLSPAVRKWNLSPLRVEELIPNISMTKRKTKKKGDNSAENHGES